MNSKQDNENFLADVGGIEGVRAELERRLPTVKAFTPAETVKYLQEVVAHEIGSMIREIIQSNSAIEDVLHQVFDVFEVYGLHIDQIPDAKPLHDWKTMFFKQVPAIFATWLEYNVLSALEESGSKDDSEFVFPQAPNVH